mmetsp:Transcript_23221/g.48291  ORF Transcript_23221/g.48291 Transcript_23221/m.48291 type:complete len:85 (+) Transcript_23221:189-443(+)|eukprot:CAMPEP_0172442504 /NCGR_PEP_ID=MMETSP1065-20121228/2917_1 /TAXON_ID=265537 /ORGANISM="Amphiprora paludosa, Strain CCMP125" /LENGTH=84 /DNA_ID=CAMNT_0013192377 /DNA_START=115 /DNA_END=369 /DNA_ORIENTATION=+
MTDPTLPSATTDEPEASTVATPPLVANDGYTVSSLQDEELGNQEAPPPPEKQPPKWISTTVPMIGAGTVLGAIAAFYIGHTFAN